MYALREHPQAIRWTWCPAAPLTGDGGEERSAYSSDKVVKFEVRDVSNGSSADLKLYKLLLSRFMFAKQWSLLNRLRYWGL